MPRRPRRCNRKLLIAFLVALAAPIAQNLVAQDPTSYLTPGVMRVGDRLACRCGGCRNTVGNCPMLHCSSADPKRQRIYELQQKGMSDNEIVNTFVREEGIVVLAAPPAQGFGGVITWIMPGVALVVGFLVYSWYVRRNRQSPGPPSAADQANIERYRAQIDRELAEPAEEDHGGVDSRK